MIVMVVLVDRGVLLLKSDPNDIEKCMVFLLIIAHTQVAGSLKVFLEGSGVLNRLEYSFYIDGPPPGPLLYCTQEQYSSLMNPPKDATSARTIADLVVMRNQNLIYEA